MNKTNIKKHPNRNIAKPVRPVTKEREQIDYSREMKLYVKFITLEFIRIVCFFTLQLATGIICNWDDKVSEFFFNHIYLYALTRGLFIALLVHAINRCARRKAFYWKVIKQIYLLIQINRLIDNDYAKYAPIKTFEQLYNEHIPSKSYPLEEHLNDFKEKFKTAITKKRILHSVSLQYFYSLKMILNPIIDFYQDHHPASYVKRVWERLRWYCRKYSYEVGAIFLLIVLFSYYLLLNKQYVFANYFK